MLLFVPPYLANKSISYNQTKSRSLKTVQRLRHLNSGVINSCKRVRFNVATQQRVCKQLNRTRDVVNRHSIVFDSQRNIQLGSLFTSKQ